MTELLRAAGRHEAAALGDAVTPAGFRDAMSRFPTGVTVLTSRAADGTPRGLTCSSLCSVALHPPTLLVCVRRGSPALHAMLERGAFAVNLLHRGAHRTADLFASGAPDRFDRVTWQFEPGHGGPHLVEAAHTIADCRIASRRDVGDHAVIFGEVFATTRLCDREPLLYGLRRYAEWPSGNS
ncbi:flavin reductase family protein [Nocardia sp. IFM 10818]